MAEHRKVEPAWWLSGDESCDFCIQRYSLEVEYRCIECDRPVCPLCVVEVREKRELYCPECDPEQGNREQES